MRQAEKDVLSPSSSANEPRDSSDTESAASALRGLQISAVKSADGDDEHRQEAVPPSVDTDPPETARSISIHNRPSSTPSLPAAMATSDAQNASRSASWTLFAKMGGRTSLPQPGNKIDAEQQFRDPRPKHDKPYQKKNPIFHKEHKARSKSKTQKQLQAIVSQLSQLKTTFKHRFRTSAKSMDELLTYQFNLAHKLQDPRTEEEVNAEYLGNILRRSLAQQKQVLRPPRRLLKEQKRLHRAQQQRERKLRGIVGRQPLPPELEDAQERKVDETLRRPGKIAQMPGAGVEAHDIAKLRPREWLNDEVINFYMKLIERRSNTAVQKRAEAAEARKRLSLARAAREEGREVDEQGSAEARERDMHLIKDVNKRWNGVWNVHVFNTFFYEKLSKQGYAGVRQWTRKVDIFTKDLILLPINVGQHHWTCAVINMRQCRFEYYDSMHSPNRRVYATLAAYLMDEYADKKKGEFGDLDLRGWDHYFSRQSPAQSNGYDCGVFASMTLEQLSRRNPRDGPLPPALDAKTVVMRSAELAARDDKVVDSSDSVGSDTDDESDEELWNFSQDNMAYLRRRMIYEIVTTDLLD